MLTKVHDHAFYTVKGREIRTAPAFLSTIVHLLQAMQQCKFSVISIIEAPPKLKILTPHTHVGTKCV